MKISLIYVKKNHIHIFFEKKCKKMHNHNNHNLNKLNLYNNLYNSLNKFNKFNNLNSLSMKFNNSWEDNFRMKMFKLFLMFYQVVKDADIVIMTLMTLMILQEVNVVLLHKKFQVILIYNSMLIKYMIVYTQLKKKNLDNINFHLMTLKISLKHHLIIF